ncbi:MAG: hypothetical protein QOE94_540, partial [Mycobacterium sp.]|nr:hypothetical protein [Mycobacterium sp.]
MDGAVLGRQRGAHPLSSRYQHMENKVEFGLLYEWQMPAGISRDEESRHFLQMIEQVKLAEEVGFTSVWSVEHHFLESFSHASAPEVLLSWIAAQTSTIRVGHGV